MVSPFCLGQRGLPARHWIPLPHQGSFSLQPFRLEMGYQRVDDGLHRAIQYLRQLVNREPNPVVGDTVLGEVIGADFFAAVAATDHLLPFLRQRLLLLLHLDLIETRAQNAHGFFAVLDLRLFVLAAHHRVGGNVGNAYRGVGRVHGLAARSGGAEGVDANVFGIDFDVDFLGFRQHRDRDRRSVHAALLFGLGYALYAMDSALIFQLGVDAVALDHGDHFFKPAHARLRAR